MTQAAAIELLLVKFEEFGITREFLNEQFKNMRKKGWSVQRIYNCLRFMFASDFNTHEVFTDADIKLMTGKTMSELEQEIIEKGDDPNDYFESVDGSVSFSGIEVIST